MALSNFLSKLNWRLILIHFFACWLIMHGLRQLGYLHDYSYIEKLINHDYKELNAVRISTDLLYIELIGLAGILISFVMSLLLSLKFRWLWVNSVIVLLVTLALWRFDRFFWYYAKYIFMAPGMIFKSDWAYSFSNGLILLSLGLLLFFMKKIINFIGVLPTESPN